MVMELLFLQLGLARDVVGGVQVTVPAGGAALGEHRLGADAQHQLAASHDEGLALRPLHAGHHVAAGFGVVHDLLHVVLKAHLGQPRRSPPAVGVVLGARQVKTFAEVVRVDLPLFLAVVQEAEITLGVRQADQVGQEGVLQRGVVDQHSGMPVELRVTFQKTAFTPAIGSARQARLRLNGPSPMATKS
jgi:hypothetical protein